MAMASRSGYIVVAAVVAALALSGCVPKEEEFVPPPPPAAKKKAVDIFDEFYVDDAKKGLSSAPAAAAPAGNAASAGSISSVSPGSYKFNPNGRYVVQVNSTASQGGAQRMVSKLKNAGYPAYIAEVENPTPELTGLYFRVRIGGFDALADAKSFAENTLRPDGFDYWVDRKANDNVGIQGPGFGAYQQHSEYQQYQAPPPAPAPAQYAPAPAAHPAQAPAAHQAPAPATHQAPAPAPAPAAHQAAPAHTAAPPPQAAPAPRPATPPPAAAAPAAKTAAPQHQAAPAPAKNDWGNTTDQWDEGTW